HPNHQRLLHLREVDGLSYQDIAQAAGTTVDATCAALYRARQRLREAYGRLAASALAGVALAPIRQLRRRAEIVGHYAAQMAAALATPGQTVGAPEQATFSQVTPASADGRELYASGYAHSGCVSSCFVLFHSSDAGASWQRTGAVGFTGGQVMVPPDAADHRIFAAAPSALQVSADNGATFSTVAPLGGPAAISPAFSSGDPRILLGAAPGWAYHDDLKTASPLDFGPIPTGPTTFAFAPTYPPDGHI